jgi:hypothetical protein
MRLIAPESALPAIAGRYLLPEDEDEDGGGDGRTAGFDLDLDDL